MSFAHVDSWGSGDLSVRFIGAVVWLFKGMMFDLMKESNLKYV